LESEGWKHYNRKFVHGKNGSEVDGDGKRQIIYQIEDVLEFEGS
jgi:hypothetical protein